LCRSNDGCYFFFEHDEWLSKNYERLYIEKGGDQNAPKIPDGFNWLMFYDKLSNGDATKYDEVGELNYTLCLNKLSLMSYQDEIREYYEKQQNKKR